jgi:hypothetical protein
MWNIKQKKKFSAVVYLIHSDVAGNLHTNPIVEQFWQHQFFNLFFIFVMP